MEEGEKREGGRGRGSLCGMLESVSLFSLAVGDMSEYISKRERERKSREITRETRETMTEENRKEKKA
jgi:hypothetical protein